MCLTPNEFLYALIISFRIQNGVPAWGEAAESWHASEVLKLARLEHILYTHCQPLHHFLIFVPLTRAVEGTTAGTSLTFQASLSLEERMTSRNLSSSTGRRGYVDQHSWKCELLDFNNLSLSSLSSVVDLTLPSLDSHFHCDLGVFSPSIGPLPYSPADIFAGS